MKENGSELRSCCRSKIVKVKPFLYIYSEGVYLEMFAGFNPELTNVTII